MAEGHERATTDGMKEARATDGYGRQQTGLKEYSVLDKHLAIDYERTAIRLS